MTETLLQRLFDRVDRIESATISHTTAISYSAEALAELVSNGILGQRFRAAKIPRPTRFGAGDDLDVRETSQGIFGVADVDDFIEPLPLIEDDRSLYPISLPHLVDAIRKDNNIDGTGCRNDGGLISIGQKSIAGVGSVGVHLSLPNSSEDSVMARCRRLVPIAGDGWIALLTPGALDLFREDLGILTSSRIVTISLMGAAGKGHLKVNWDEAFRRDDPVSSDGVAVVGRDLERLIQGEEHVGIVKAATYLELSIEHIRRLVRKGKLVRLGQGRPMKISVKSLRVYKGTAHPGPAKKETPA